MRANDFVKLTLESPFHMFLQNIMLITVTGRRSGRAITTPVNYYQDGDILWIISSRSRNWWRNVASACPVQLHVRGRDAWATAELVLDEKSVAAGVGAYVRHLPAAARALGIRMEKGVPNVQDLERAARERLLITVCLN